MSGRGGQITGRAGVDAAVLAAEFLEDEQTVELARLHFDIEMARNGPPVSHPAHLNRKVSSRDGAGHLSPPAVQHLRWESKRLDNRRPCPAKEIIKSCPANCKLLLLK